MCISRKRHCCSRISTIIGLSLFGVLLIILGVILRPIVDNVFHTKIDENLVLGTGKPTYKPWHKSTVPINSYFYFFDVLNPEEIRNGEKPVVLERGPYKYLAFTEKVNITWHDTNATVGYDEKTWYGMTDNATWDSYNPFTDHITTVNIPLLVVAELLIRLPDYLHWKLLVSQMLREYSEGLFITRTVHELLWGYEDRLLVQVEELRQKYPILKELIPKVDPVVRLLYNNTLQGWTTIHTGAKNIKNLQNWISWKGKDGIGFWLTKYANMLNGTDGRQFAPWITKSDTIYFVTVQLCRSLYLNFDHQLTYRDIKVYRFVISRKIYLNGSVEPDNAAFYPQGFLPTGILDPRKCQGGAISAPIFLSAPHFYQGDPSLVDAVEGMKPDKAKHALYFDIVPELGSPLRNAIRFQVNAFMEPVKDITETSGIKKTYMPIMWFQESAVIDTDTTDLFKDDIFIPMEVCHYVEIAMICIGGLLFIVEMILLCRAMRKRSKFKLLCNGNEEERPILRDSRVSN